MVLGSVAKVSLPCLSEHVVAIVKSSTPVTSRQGKLSTQAMEIAQATQAPTQPLNVVARQSEVAPVEAVGNNQAEPNNPIASVKAPRPHSAPIESRPAALAGASSNNNDGDTYAVISKPPHTSRSSEGTEVVTPAGTVEAPICSTEAPSTERDQTPAQVVENESKKVDQSIEHKAELQDVAPSTTAATTEPTPTAPSLGNKPKTEKKQANNDSFASEQVLSKVQKFLTLQIVENRCSSHSKEIHEFVEKNLDEKQRKRYIAPLLELIMQHFTQEATAKGEEVSIDVQSNICLIEQMFLTLGRRSPLEDMYTAEEEEMLDLLFHSNSSDNLLINTST